MKEAISGMGLYIIVITFIALFTAYVAVTTTYSRCFRVKDEIVSVIEYYRGINEESEEEIKNLLRGINYVSSGECPQDGSSNIKWNEYSLSGATGYGHSTNFCIAKFITASNATSSAPASSPNGYSPAGVGLFNEAYYRAVIFYKLEWPIMRNIFQITLAGETQIIINPRDRSGIQFNSL